jgi:hypothetical protein
VKIAQIETPAPPVSGALDEGAGRCHLENDPGKTTGSCCCNADVEDGDRATRRTILTLLLAYGKTTYSRWSLMRVQSDWEPRLRIEGDVFGCRH